MSVTITKQEMYKLRQLEFKEKNKKNLCIVNLVSTVVTVVMLVGTLYVINSYPKCEGTWLTATLWAMIGMHAINITEAVCGMTGLDHIFCGCLCVVGFFAYEVVVLVYMNTIYYSHPECHENAPE